MIGKWLDDCDKSFAVCTCMFLVLTVTGICVMGVVFCALDVWHSHQVANLPQKVERSETTTRYVIDITGFPQINFSNKDTNDE